MRKTNTLRNVIVLIGALLLAVGIGATSSETAKAQMSNSNMTANSSQNQTFSKEMMGSYKPSTNGSLSLGPTMSKALRTQAHISLDNASIIAEKAVGANAHTVKARIGVWTNGAIVYLELVVDSKDNFHGVVVDAKNGRLYNLQQIVSSYCLNDP